MKAEHATRRRTDAKGKKRQPVHIGTALADFVASLGIDGTLKRYALIAGWADVVGEQIARVTEPQRFENGVLFVHVKTAPWRTELSMQRGEIIRKLNSAAGADVVKDIRFR